MLKVPLFDVGKWDPKTDKTDYIQLFISSAALAYIIVTFIVLQLLLYGSNANEVDHDFVKLLNQRKQNIIRLKTFANRGLVHRHNGRILIKHDKNKD